MHCVSSLPSRVLSQERAAGLGTLSPSPRAPARFRRVPISRAGLSAQPRAGQGGGHPGTPAPSLPASPEGSSHVQGALAAHRCPFQGLRTQSAFLGSGERRCIGCPLAQPLGEGTTLLPKQPRGLKKPHSLSSAISFPCSSSALPSPVSCWLPGAPRPLGSCWPPAPALQAQRAVLVVPQKAARDRLGANACPWSRSALGRSLCSSPEPRARCWEVLLLSQEPGRGHVPCRYVNLGRSEFELQSLTGSIQVLGFWG